MPKDSIASGLLLLLSFHILSAQGPPASGTYLITSGTYIECCGFIGVPLETPLPDGEQSYLRLTVDQTNNRAAMTILGYDLQTIFTRDPCPSTPPLVFSLQNGIMESNRIVFSNQMLPFGSVWEYVVSNTADGLRLNGTVRISVPGCADVPTRFAHTNVVASPLPAAVIRASEVEICWNSILNRSHQVQYRSNIDTNQWIDLGSAIVGNGQTNCVTDKIAPGAPRRFYRVIVIP